MATYSFKDVQATIQGVGGSINLGYGAALSEEGITIEPAEDKNIMTIGADGQGMHSLVASEAASVTVRLLKTSPTNSQLQQMFNLQADSSLAHGKNTITVRDIARGDCITLTGVAFRKRPSVTYAKEGGTVEWQFDAIRVSATLGTGTPEL